MFGEPAQIFLSEIGKNISFTRYNENTAYTVEIDINTSTSDDFIREIAKLDEEKEVFITLDALDCIKNKLIFVFGAYDFYDKNRERNNLLIQIYEKLDTTIKVIKNDDQATKKYEILIYLETENKIGLVVARINNSFRFNIKIESQLQLLLRKLEEYKIIFITENAVKHFVRTYIELDEKKNLLLKFIELTGYQIYPWYIDFNNKFNKYLPNMLVNKMIGPNFYAEYTRTVNEKIQNIGVFGERNLIPNNDTDFLVSDSTQRVASFIRNLIDKNRGKKYDLFLEKPEVSKKLLTRERKKSYTINSMIIEFSLCFEVNKEDCAFKNLRGHYIDYRDEKIIKELKNQNSKIIEILNEIKDNINKNRKIDHRLIDEKTKEFLKNFFERELTMELVNYESNYESFFALFEEYDTIIKILKSASNENDFMENVIIYASDIHCEVFCECLETLGFEKIIEIKDKIEIVDKYVLGSNMVEFTENEKNKSFLFEIEDKIDKKIKIY